MGVSLDRRIGRADDSDEKRLPSGAASLAGDLEREGAPACEDGQRRACAARFRFTVRFYSPLLVPSGARNANRPIAPLTQKGDDLLDSFLVGERLCDLVDALPQCAPAIEQHLVGTPQLVDRLVREASALQADDIQAREPRPVAERKPKGDQIVLDASETADKGVSSDTNELMRGGAAAHNSEITDIAVTGQHHVVGKNDALANTTIMRDMSIG